MRHQSTCICFSGMTIDVGCSAPPTSRRLTGTLQEKRKKIDDEKSTKMWLSGSKLECHCILSYPSSTALRICSYSKLYYKIVLLEPTYKCWQRSEQSGEQCSERTMPNSLTAVNVRSMCVRPTGPGQCKRKIYVKDCQWNWFMFRLWESFQTRMLLWHQSHLHLENMPTIGK